MANGAVERRWTGAGPAATRPRSAPVAITSRAKIRPNVCLIGTAWAFGSLVVMVFVPERMHASSISDSGLQYGLAHQASPVQLLMSVSDSEEDNALLIKRALTM